MYYYILDPGKISLPKFEQIQVELQGLLHEFNISGEFARITTLRTVSDLVDVAASRGASTVVVCGNDDTLNQVLAAVGQRDFLVGFIPLDPQSSYLAKILGLPNLLTSVKTIAARRIVTIDTATINQLAFISFLEFGVTSNNLSQIGPWKTFNLLSKSAAKWTLKIDTSYTLNIRGLGGLIINSRSTSSKQEKIANPTDGFLDVLVMEEIGKLDIFKYKDLIAQGRLEELPNPTIIKCKTVELLEPRGSAITMFGRPVAKFPAIVSMTGRKQRMIVGKQRTF
jgi:diacylglycerol kinase family enzyme